MKCPSCGETMNEVSKWQMAPFGGYECPSCGLKISKKTSDKVQRIKRKKIMNL
jgi:transposase-like protein